MKLIKEEVLHEVKWRIDSMRTQIKGIIPKEKQKQVDELLEIEINNILNIAFQNKDYFIYSQYKGD